LFEKEGRKDKKESRGRKIGAGKGKQRKERLKKRKKLNENNKTYIFFWLRGSQNIRPY
jgi:hypothetical protein